MERLILKKEVLDRIKKDPILYGQVASLTGHTILSMRKVLDENKPKLTQFSVLKHLSEYLKIKDQNDLLEVEPEDNNNTQIAEMQENV